MELPHRVKLHQSGSKTGKTERCQGYDLPPADGHAHPPTQRATMGASPSVPIPGGGTEGYHVLRVRTLYCEASQVRPR